MSLKVNRVRCHALSRSPKAASGSRGLRGPALHTLVLLECHPDFPATRTSERNAGHLGKAVLLVARKSGIARSPDLHPHALSPSAPLPLSYCLQTVSRFRDLGCATPRDGLRPRRQNHGGDQKTVVDSAGLCLSHRVDHHRHPPHRVVDARLGGMLMPISSNTQCLLEKLGSVSLLTSCLL